MPENVKMKTSPDYQHDLLSATKSVLTPFNKRKQLERDIEHITQEMYKRNKELNDTNRTLSLLRTIDAMVLEPHASLKMVCGHITAAIMQSTDYPFVGLFTRATQSREELTLYGWSSTALTGNDPESPFAKPLHLPLANKWLAGLEDSRLVSLEGLDAASIASVLGCSIADIESLRDRLPLKSCYIVKLLVRRKLVGLLVAGFYNSSSQLTDAEPLLIDSLSESIGVALDNKLLFEENQRVLRKLKESNNKLLALDQTKDDFISMASHQLRTPLTSVKGYISLVMEGDAGKVTPKQHEMLGQAFYSSQRMVYLIADLLNVSRLRTGKFIVDSHPVNLAEMVDQELCQLKETASARSIKLIYKKPNNLPDLMLDETKTRQVIMNFVDNAIYYTPAGGHITVRLIDEPKTLELRVEDDGIGVPRSEQKHLFTKFYRAGNARKARPDGTGLGLFMAKKVIIAQGGSLIFESREGQGSTFGFTLNKSKLARSQ